MAELYHYWPKIRVGGWAVFHDTEWPADKHDHYLGRDWGQAIEGVNAYFGSEDRREVLRFHYPESYGMTFIQKLKDWIPIGVINQEILDASKMLTEALCK